MPSDVHVEQSATFDSSPSLYKEPMETRESSVQSESIYLKRYQALRDAGFDETTANKYSPLYSSVNEVIDAILSQSLNDNLVLHSNGQCDNVQNFNHPNPLQELDCKPNEGQFHCLEGSDGSICNVEAYLSNVKQFDVGNGVMLNEKNCPTNSNSNKLIVTMIKDGLLEDSSDEITLEDDGLAAEQNGNSCSPSASSSLSSGISSFFIDTSSSPSSFSSLSSSISMTPPNLAVNFECNLSNHNDNAYLTKHPLKTASNIQKYKSNEPVYCQNGRETNDLNCETLDNLSSKSNHGTQNAIHNDAFGDQLKPINSIMKIGNSQSKAYSKQTNIMLNNNEHSLDQTRPNVGNANAFLSSMAYDGQRNNNNNNIMLTMDKTDLSTNDDLLEKNDSSIQEKSVLNDLLGFFNLPVRCTNQSFFKFDQNCTDDNVDIGDENSAINDKNDLSKNENQLNAIKNNYNHHLFAENGGEHGASIFNTCSNESAQLRQSHHHHHAQHYSMFLANNNQQPRTFADITASSLMSSNNTTSNDETFIAILDSPKANLNGYYNAAFTNNQKMVTNGNSSSSMQSYYDQQYEQNALNKKFFRKQLNYLNGSPSLSSINEKITKGQTKEQQTQLSFIASTTTIRSTNSTLSLESGHLTNDENAIESNQTANQQIVNRPTNLMGYKGLWVCNVSPDVGLHYLKRRFRRFGHFNGIQTFERRATNGTNIVFVHYDNPYSPVDAIASLHNYNGQDLCADPNEPLKLRFAPSMEQSRAGQLPTLEQARKIVEKSGECFNWRLSSGCHRGSRCHLKHVPINKEIDSQPWVKALKKKVAEA